MKKIFPAALFTPRRIGLFALLLVILAVLAYKSYDEGWFMSRKPLVLNGKPALLFFNRHKGCECALAVYQAADSQVQDWSEEERQGLQFIRVDLDRQPERGLQFDVLRAPTLLLVDGGGRVVYRQDEVVTDTQPFNLVVLEEKIAEMLILQP